MTLAAVHLVLLPEVGQYVIRITHGGPHLWDHQAGQITRHQDICERRRAPRGRVRAAAWDGSGVRENADVLILRAITRMGGIGPPDHNRAGLPATDDESMTHRGQRSVSAPLRGRRSPALDLAEGDAPLAQVVGR